MKILVVSGFLGAGKTTFIKNLIRRTKKPLVVLENEYGENNLDSRDLQTASNDGINQSPLEVMEFMEGCICCSKKDSFANTVLAISASLDPEYLIVEPTGIGRLSSILENIQKIVYERIEVLPPIVILSPQNIQFYKNNIHDIYVDQVSHAHTIIFSKIENESVELLSEAEKQIRKLNPHAELVTMPYKDKDDAWYNGLLDTKIKSSDFSKQHPDTKDFEHDDGDHEHFEQVTLYESNLVNITELIQFLEDIVRGDCGLIFRSKGVLKVANQWLRFDVADRLYGIICEQSDNPQVQLVFIGKELDESYLRNRLGLT